MSVWACKIGDASGSAFKDENMRTAVVRAYEQLTGQQPDFIFSGWGGDLSEAERAVVENREPDPRKIFDDHTRIADTALEHHLFGTLRAKDKT
jgi:hypothetical protein